MALTDKQKRALAGLATPGEDNQKFHAGVMPLAGDENPDPDVPTDPGVGSYQGLAIGSGIGIGLSM